MAGAKESKSVVLAKQGVCNICDHRWSMTRSTQISHKWDELNIIMKLLCPPGYHQGNHWWPVGTKYSRMDQVKFVVDSLRKIWSDLVCSSIVNEVIETISSLFFLYEKILSVKKASKCKANDFPPLRNLCVRKKLLPLLIFVCLILFC